MAAGDKTVKDLGYLSKNQGMASAIVRHNRPSAPGQIGHGDRSDRFAGEERRSATNVAREGPVGAGARRVVLGSAGHLERPQST